MSAPFPPPQGRLPSIEWVPIAVLEIDDSYQRSIETGGSKKLIAEIARAWDWDLLDVLKVSRRPDDRLFVVDGQHRKAAAALRGDIPQLPCVLKRCAGAAEEARLFAATNRGRKPMSALDSFRADVASGTEEAVTINDLVVKAGLSIPRHYLASGAGPGEIASTGGMRTILRRRGPAVLEQVLTLIGEAFPDEVLTSPTPMMHALTSLLAVQEPPADYDRLFETLLSGTTAEWHDWAGLGAIAGGMSRVIALRAAILAKYETLAMAA